MKASLDRQLKRLEELVPKEQDVSVHTIQFIDSDGTVSGTMELCSAGRLAKQKGRNPKGVCEPLLIAD